MRNILATSPGQWASVREWLAPALAAAAAIGAVWWGSATTQRLHALERREVVTVQLGKIMGEFVEAEARSAHDPSATRERIALYLKAVEASVARLGREGRTVLVAEAVVAGSAPDMTDQVRLDVARRLQGAGDGPR